MRVLMITPYMKPIMGGISTYLDGLSRGLRKQDAACAVITEKGESTPGSSRTDRSLIRFLAEGILAVLRFRPSVIHIHSNWRGFLMALAYRRLFRHTALFFTFHTDSLSPLSGAKKTIFERMLSKCDALIFTSSHLRSETEPSLSIKARSRVIYAGVSKMPTDNGQVQSFRETHSLDGKFPVLLYMTPFVWEEKVSSIETLGEALRRLENKELKPILVVLGEGPLRGRVKERISKLDLDDVVVLAGRVDDPWTALATCDIYTHISQKESLSMAILEAMSVGKPVIATDVGGTPEILSKEGVGVLVSPDLADIETTILTLSSNREEMKAMGARAREWVEANFTWKRSAEDHLKLYKEALGET